MCNKTNIENENISKEFTYEELKILKSRFR